MPVGADWISWFFRFLSISPDVKKWSDFWWFRGNIGNEGGGFGRESPWKWGREGQFWQWVGRFWKWVVYLLKNSYMDSAPIWPYSRTKWGVLSSISARLTTFFAQFNTFDAANGQQKRGHKRGFNNHANPRGLEWTLGKQNHEFIAMALKYMQLLDFSISLLLL